MASEHVEYMTKAKMNLQSFSQEHRNKDYQKIVDAINSYLNKHCSHHIIEDRIDIDYECSKTIFYCEHCLTTFHNIQLQKKKD